MIQLFGGNVESSYCRCHAPTLSPSCSSPPYAPGRLETHTLFCPLKDGHKDVHDCFRGNSPNLEAPHVSVNSRIDERVVVIHLSYGGVLPSREELRAERKRISQTSRGAMERPKLSISIKFKARLSNSLMVVKIVVTSGRGAGRRF